MGPGFAFPLPGLGTPIADVFFPFSFTPTVMSLRADSFSWVAFGRLRDGVTIDQAQASLREIARLMPQRYPETWGRLRETSGEMLVHVKSLRTAAVGDSRRPLLVLLGAVGFVLLIACTNVASLFVARASARRQEIAIRKALGAASGRLVQQFLVEALILLGLGSLLGVVAARWGTRILVAMAPNDLYRSFNASIDGRVLAVTAGVTVLTAILFSILPVLRGLVPSSESALRDEGRASTATRVRQRGRRLLIVAEVGIAVVLTVGAGLMLRSLARVRAVNPGFDPQHLITFTASLPASRYADGVRVKLAEQQLLQRLREIPGVQAVSATSHLPMYGLWQITFTPEGDALPNMPVATNTLALPGFFETMRIPLRAGRTLTDQDALGTEPVVVINETLARKYYGTTNAVGRQFKWGPRTSPEPWRRIVGVVADVKQQRLDEETSPGVYIPALQMPDSGINVSMYRNVSYVVRTAVPLGRIAPSIRSTIRTFDPRLAVLGVQPMSVVIGNTTNERRFNATLLGLFAALALALAATGVYGVLQYSVVQRTREIGIRIAVGAATSNIIRLIVGHAVGLALVGIALGLAGAFALTRVIRALLFNTSPFDLATFAGSAAVLLVIVALASYLPARRALRIDPSLAMRND
jgi:predicted permease